jgi:hypothetical protein
METNRLSTRIVVSDRPEPPAPSPGRESGRGPSRGGGGPRHATLVRLTGFLLFAIATACPAEGPDALYIDADGKVGVGTTQPKATLDIQQANRTSPENHPKEVPGLYVTGDFGEAKGVELRHSNGSQGIGIGFNTLYATGSNTDQKLGLKPRGNAAVEVQGPLTVKGKLTVEGDVVAEAVRKAMVLLVPVGTIVAYGGDTTNGETVKRLREQGWLPCNGGQVGRKDYPLLFEAIGTSFGASNGDTFNLPDFRGRFLRGTDQGARRDPDAAGRGPSAAGGNGGDRVGSLQDDQFKSHTHTEYRLGDHDRGGWASGGYWASVGAQSGPAGGNETRPKNVGVNWIIKAANP